MNKKKNSLPRKEAWKRFYDGIMRLRADIKFAEFDEDSCIEFLKQRGYKIFRPRPTEYDEV